MTWSLPARCSARSCCGRRCSSRGCCPSASAACLCDFQVVSIGGGLSQAGAVLFDPLEEAFRAHARLDFVRHLRVVPAALGGSAGLVGAAALILAGERYWTGD